jgi:hypothetical protein
MLLFSLSVTTELNLMAHTVSAAVNRRDSKGTAEIKRHSASPLVIIPYFVPTPRAMFFHSHHNDSLFCDISNLKTFSKCWILWEELCDSTMPVFFSGSSLIDPGIVHVRFMFEKNE